MVKTNGIEILLQVATKSDENRFSIRTVNWFYFLNWMKLRIGTVNCPYSSDFNGVRTVLTLISSVTSASLLAYASSSLLVF